MKATGDSGSKQECREYGTKLPHTGWEERGEKDCDNILFAWFDFFFQIPIPKLMDREWKQIILIQQCNFCARVFG